MERQFQINWPVLVEEAVRRVDGVLLSGGEDVDPKRYTRTLPANVAATVHRAHPDRDIFELRLTLEVGLADLLYLRKTKKDVEELEQIAKNQKVTGGRQTFRIKNEIAFHGKIYQMTGNETLQRFQSMLLPVFGYLVSLEKVPIIGRVSHLDLVEILKHGSKEEFRQGMLQHLEHHFAKLK